MTRQDFSQRPLRLLVDGHTFDVGPQGTTTFLAGLLNATSQAAAQLGLPDPLLYCASADRSSAERFLHVPFQHVPIRSGFFARNAVDLPRISRTLRPDTTISQYVRPFVLAGHSTSVIHDVLFLDFPQQFGWRYRTTRKLLFGWSARHSDTVVTVSEYSRQRLAHWFALEARNICVIPNGVALQESPNDMPRDRHDGAQVITMLFVSRLEQRKRQDWCIEALESLSKRGHKMALHLVGSGEGAYAEEIRAKVAAAQARGECVELHSNISGDELEALMQRTSLALFPSRCEGFGIPVIEASARGIPCVVANNTGLGELRPWFAGRMFDSGDRNDFFNSIESAIKSLGDLHREAAELAPAVAEAFGWQHAARSFLQRLVGDIGR